MTNNKKPKERPKTVLFIDDEASWLEAVKIMSKGATFNLITAEGGELAMIELHKRIPDLILSDVRMPVINGFDLFDQVKKDPKLKSVPYVFMSSIEDFDAKRTAKQLGADGYIEKPYNSEQLKTIISDLLTHFQGG